MNKIKADHRHVIKAYMVDINPFCRGLVRRVLIDEYGMVFIPTYGWSSIQSSYRIIPLPDQVKLPKIGMWEHMWADWWERPAWDTETWAWTHFRKQPDFHACYRMTDSYGNTAIFAH
jgi:hypothetical protein